ncbi:molybdopterin molybdenumtransferase MoeA [Litorimonas cladophorae]|uniref:Molybdopterin molybdenumtransferase n=1 Tax=Litorimonas cladophorae TaxID=1220491 RepID=A0A918KJ31_9PROT|nr:molybdopterin molybdotransferase MoeA [Litorimonas cladophorae]GGX62777.1 molybdopterin molybdenumtransferase MoeA [Litorimonas cladophorae]
MRRRLQATDFKMISVSDALLLIDQHRPDFGAETVSVNDAFGRVTAKDIFAGLDMPPFKSSSMDGYAVQACKLGETLRLIGEASAGIPFGSDVEAGEAVKISTGAIAPNGTDRILRKEQAVLKDSWVTVRRAPRADAFIRPRASDFPKGKLLVSKGERLNPAHLTLCAAANHATVDVKRKPKVALMSSGNELRALGSDILHGEIFSANAVGLKAALEAWGADVTDLGIVRDDEAEIREKLKQLQGFDIVIPIGGASVGDHDLLRPAFRAAGYDSLFESVAMKPGKPCWMMRKASQIILGLPGNPASTFVGAHVFLRPLLGLPNVFTTVVLAEALDENGPRETYLRATISNRDGVMMAAPYPVQDSYRLLPQATSNSLLRIPAMGGPYKVGQKIQALNLHGRGCFW